METISLFVPLYFSIIITLAMVPGKKMKKRPLMVEGGAIGVCDSYRSTRFAPCFPSFNVKQGKFQQSDNIQVNVHR